MNIKSKTSESAISISDASFEEQTRAIQKLIQTADFNQAIAVSDSYLEQVKSAAHKVEILYLKAVACRYKKDNDHAHKTLQQLIKLADNHPRSYQEQGYLYLAEQKADLAKLSFEKAVKLNPSLVASWQELIELYRKSNDAEYVQHAANQLAKLKSLPPALLAVTEFMNDGKLIKAEQICRQFLQNNKRNVDGMCLLAEIGIELKIYDDAEFLLTTALELEPEHIHARSLFLNLSLKLGKYKKAQELVLKLLAQQPENVSFMVAKANVLAGLGQVSEAIALFDNVITVGHKNPEFYLQHGHALKVSGNITAAVEAYQNAYKVNPKFGDAYWSLANTKTYRFSDTEVTQMEKHVGLTDQPLQDKIQMLFALGKAKEDNKEFAEAFKAYKLGNALQKQYSGFNIENVERQIDHQIKYCDSALFEKRSHVGNPCKDPIFIVGLPRAGSTLLEQILASHSQVDGTMELHQILGLASKLRGRAKVDNSAQQQELDENVYPRNLHKLEDTYFQRFGEQFIEETKVYRESAPLFIDKMPNNFLHLGLIKLILPNAKIIDARRSPMACCFSGFKQLFAEGQEFSYDLEDIGRYYNGYLKLMDHWKAVLPDFILTVNHEDVVDDLEKEVRRLLDFCGLEFEPACLEFHKTKRNIKTPSSEQVRQPIYKSATEQWRYFEPYLSDLKRVLDID